MSTKRPIYIFEEEAEDVGLHKEIFPSPGKEGRVMIAFTIIRDSNWQL